MKTKLILLSMLLCLPSVAPAQTLPQGDMATMETLFRELPMEAKRLTGPLFWLHGDESKARLEMYLDKVAESGNGGFTAESRPHRDWLGEGWYRDLSICLEAAKKHNLEMWIFDEKWWPSQMIGGKVPAKYATKVLVAEVLDVEGPKVVEADGYGGPRYVAAVAGKSADGGAIDAESLVDLADGIKDGKLTWQAPAGKWKVIKFTHKQGPGLGQGSASSIDGASRDCTDYFIRTVYQPHYDRYQADFGKTIAGFFYDEPETRGDWGTELNAVLAEWKVDWKKAYVAYKLRLVGEDDAAARFQYMDAFAEAWGRTMYGSMSRWCRQRGVKSMGHFMEHGYLYVNPEFCAGDMMRLQKYSDMGGIDLVCRQMYPGQRPRDIYQTPKLGSSITHVFNKPDDITICEMFGAYGQDITYSQMKWLTDQMQVRGVNFMIPHSFNPRAPHDTDCPPYFYNGGFEPRYPLYRVYADYTSRLSLLLSAGRHVCPVAVLFAGNLRRVGKAGTPEDVTSSLQDALFDCDWLPMEVLESGACTIDAKVVKLHQECYKVLLVPPTEVIPYGTLARVREFFDKGGIVIACGYLPAKSATIGKTAADIAVLRGAVWGEDPKCGTTACKTSPAGGRSYLLAEKPTPEDIAVALTGDAGLHPTLEILQGQTNNWLHVLHRVKAGRDVFLVCNQNHQGQARHFRFRVTAAGVPEVWDAMRNEITAVAFERKGEAAELELTLEPNESVLLVFQEQARPLPPRLSAATKVVREPIEVVRQPTPDEAKTPSRPPAQAAVEPKDKLSIKEGTWIWHDEGSVGAAVRYFRSSLDLPEGRAVKSARAVLTCDNFAVLHVNGKQVGKTDDELQAGWRHVVQIDLKPHLKAGRNVLAVRAENFDSETDNPAGLIAVVKVEFDQGQPLLATTCEAWKSADKEQPGWTGPSFDDSRWTAAKVVAKYSGGPWGAFEDTDGGGPLTPSPVISDPFICVAELPADVDLKSARVCLEMEGLPDAAACVRVNGAFAGGCIGGPTRVNVTAQLKPGKNTIEILPQAPKEVKLVVYPIR
jgi:hypothetical protein